MIGDTEYLIVTRNAAACVQQALGQYLPEARTRAFILAILKGAKLLFERPGRTGLDRCYFCRDYDDNSYQVFLCWGHNKDGQPQLAPDGVKHCVYLTGFKRVPCRATQQRF